MPNWKSKKRKKFVSFVRPANETALSVDFTSREAGFAFYREIGRFLTDCGMSPGPDPEYCSGEVHVDLFLTQAQQRKYGAKIQHLIEDYGGSACDHATRNRSRLNPSRWTPPRDEPCDAENIERRCFNFGFEDAFWGAFDPPPATAPDRYKRAYWEGHRMGRVQSRSEIAANAPLADALGWDVPRAQRNPAPPKYGLGDAVKVETVDGFITQALGTVRMHELLPLVRHVGTVVDGSIQQGQACCKVEFPEGDVGAATVIAKVAVPGIFFWWFNDTDLSLWMEQSARAAQVTRELHGDDSGDQYKFFAQTGKLIDQSYPDCPECGTPTQYLRGYDYCPKCSTFAHATPGAKKRFPKMNPSRRRR